MSNDFNQTIMSARKNAIKERKQQVVDAYIREYVRVNARKPTVEINRGWVKVNGNSYLFSDFCEMLDTLKTRASFYP